MALLALVAGCGAGAQSVPVDEPPAESPGRQIDTRRGRYGPRLERPDEARNSYAPFISMLVPGYSVRVAGSGEPEDPWEPGEAVEQGLVWSVPFIVQSGDWRHGGALSFAQYFRSRRQEGRGTYRLRLFSAGGEDPLVHLWMGAGGFFDPDIGVGPRAELAWVFGEMGRGSALLQLGWQYAAAEDDYAFEVALAAFVPYVFR